MFKLVAIQGFRSFKGMQVFKFQGPGFRHLGGENRADPEMGANGSGKSSILEALTWCLYGKTSRGLRGKDIANWDLQDPTSVTVEFEKDRRGYTLLRTWDDSAPNALSLSEDGREPRQVEQSEIEALIGADYTTFLHTVMMSQFGSYFFDLQPMQQLSVFSDLLDLGRWEDASKSAKVKADSYGVDASAYASMVAKLEGKIEALASEVKELEAASGKFDADRKARIGVRREELTEAQAALDDAARAHATALRQFKHAEEALDEAKARLVTIDDALRDRYQPRARDRLKEFKYAQADLDTALARQNEASTLGKGECPVCRQEIGSLDLSRLMKILRREVVDAKGALDAADRKRAKADARLEKALKRRRRIDEEFTGAEADLKKARDAMAKARAAKTVAEQELKGAQFNLDQEKARTDPFAPRLEKVRRMIANGKREASKSSLAAVDARALEDRHRFWVGGFKQLRLWIVKRALLDYEVATNNALSDLGLSGWKVRYDVERETKSGTVKRGFTVFIGSPVVDREVPWEAWCGGETQRLRIAGAVGLSAVAAQYRGFHSGLEAWDEPTQHLDADGVESILAFFKDRAQAQGLELWLVDHRSLDAGEFDGTAWVVKDPKRGSRMAATPGRGARVQ